MSLVPRFESSFIDDAVYRKRVGASAGDLRLKYQLLGTWSFRLPRTV
jgi:hypothetical protein